MYVNVENATVTAGDGRFASVTGSFTPGGQLGLRHDTLRYPFLTKVDLKCRLDQAVEIVCRICASQLAFVWLRCARPTKTPAPFSSLARGVASGFARSLQPRTYLSRAAGQCVGQSPERGHDSFGHP